MKPLITFVYAYYENAGMFKLQQQIWNSYPKWCLQQIEVIVTDDCSSRAPAFKFISNNKRHAFGLYRIEEKVPWNWLEARNIGAHHARGKWLLLTDMDHVISPGVIVAVLERIKGFDKRMVYQFERVLAPNMKPYKFHNDSFLLRKDLFWKSGGYDEDLAGLYGTSGSFRNRLYSVARGHIMLDGLALILYKREVIPDASTTDLPRKNGREPDQVVKVLRNKHKRNIPICNFKQKYERLI